VLFLGPQSDSQMEGGISSTTTNVPYPPVLDDATAAILHQNAHHTQAYWWTGDSDKANQYIRMIRRPWGKFGQNAGVTPLLFFKGLPGIFNDHKESLKTSKDGVL